MNQKPPKCKHCREPILNARNSLVRSCSIECAVALARKESERLWKRQTALERKSRREAKERLKTRRDWLKEAQAAFNRWVRVRDHGLPCISCGRYHKGAWDAGHYRSVGACSALRFHPDNCHAQCVPCNQHKSGNIIEYRIGLLARIGQVRLDWIEVHHEPAKWTIEQLKQVKAEFTAKARQLERKLENAA